MEPCELALIAFEGAECTEYSPRFTALFFTERCIFSNSSILCILDFKNEYHDVFSGTGSEMTASMVSKEGVSACGRSFMASGVARGSKPNAGGLMSLYECAW